MSKKDNPNIVEWEKPSVHFEFNDNTKPKAPENFADIKIKDVLKVTVTGKVQTLREDENSKGLTITMDKVKIAIVEEGANSMSETMDSVQEARRT